MINHDEFIDYIDNLIPSKIEIMLKEEMESCDSIFDLINVQERARNLTIKHILSSSHFWMKASCADSTGYRSEIYWCDKCNIRCSAFEHVNHLSIISKVKDNLPTYTIHNKYLMFTCNEVLNMVTPGNDKSCFTCGIPEKGLTEDCALPHV